MEYRSERERLAALAGHARLAEPDGGIHTARAVVQALTATGEAFDDALGRLDATRPELAAALPAWYTATRAVGAECAILAQWWAEELAREDLRWTGEHDARLAEDVAHFEQLRARAVEELEDRAPAAAFASVAAPVLDPWEENLPPRARRWHLIAWPVAAAAVLGVGAAGIHAFEHGHTTISGVLGGNSGPAGPSTLPAAASPAATDTASPAPSPSPTPTTSTTTASPTPAMTPAATTARPTPAATASAPAAPRTTTADSVPSVEISLIPAARYPQIEALFTVTTSSSAPTTLYVTSYGVSKNGTRTAENFSSQTLTGHTTYTYTEVINTTSWCGDTVTVEATAAGGSAAAHTGAGC